MKKSLLIYGFGILLITIFLSGCQDQTPVDTNNLENIEFESDIVELAYSNFTKNIQDDKVVSVSVEYLFKNIADRDISINITAEFYDEDNNSLHTGGPNTISLPAGWTEQGISPTANRITYDGKDASEVDHVRIIVKEN